MATSKNISIQSHHLFQLVCGCKDLGSASISSFGHVLKNKIASSFLQLWTPVQPVTPGKRGCSSERRRMCLLQMYCVFAKPHSVCYHGVLRLGQSVFVKRRCWCSSDSSLWTSVWGSFSRFPSHRCDTKINFKPAACAHLPVLSNCFMETFLLPLISRVPLIKIPVSPNFSHTSRYRDGNGSQSDCQSVHLFGPDINNDWMDCHDIWLRYRWCPDDAL